MTSQRRKNHLSFGIDQILSNRCNSEDYCKFQNCYQNNLHIPRHASEYYISRSKYDMSNSYAPYYQIHQNNESSSLFFHSNLTHNVLDYSRSVFANYGNLIKPVPIRFVTAVTPSVKSCEQIENDNNARRKSWSRAVFSSLQRKGLEKRFIIQKYITKPDRRQLARTLGLTDAQVKVWFQNRRMKWRQTMQKKQGRETQQFENVSSLAISIPSNKNIVDKLESTNI